MRTKWDRAKSTGGLSIQPAYTYTLLLISFIAILGIQGFRYERVWTPLQRHYLAAYLGSRIGEAVRDNGWYTLLQVVTRKGSRLALDSDVVPVVTESGENTFALAKEALKHGALRLESRRGHYNNAEMHAFLSSLIYHNQATTDLFRPALWAGLVLFFAGVLPATYLDHKRSSAVRYGRKLTCPNSVGVAQLNISRRFRGIRLVNGCREVLDHLLGLNKKPPFPLGKDNPHILLMAEPLPRGPVKIAATTAGTDNRSQPSGPRQESAPLEQTQHQDQKLEHAVASTKRPFFE
jgi:hypothetical protein